MTGQEWIYQATRYWQVHQSEGFCPTSTWMSLYFVCLWTLHAAWFFILGSSSVRQRIHRSVRILTTCREGVGSVRYLGNLSLHFIFTVATAEMLHRKGRDGSTTGKLGDFMLAWFARPLPGIAIDIIAALNHLEYSRSAVEMYEGEVVYSIGALYIYGSVWHTVFNPSPEAKEVIARSREATQGMKMLKAGSVLGLMFTVFELLVGLERWTAERDPKVRKSRAWQTDCWFVVSVTCCGLFRMAASFLLWAGGLKLGGDAFCPSLETMGDITALWAVFPFLDLLWRCMFSPVDAQENGKANPRGDYALAQNGN